MRYYPESINTPRPRYSESEKRQGEREALEQSRTVKKFIEAAAMGYKQENIPVDANGRIDMQAFRNIHPDVEKDQAGVAQRFQKWHGGIPAENLEETLLLADGERLEMLAYAIFYKQLREKFIVVRSARHDDEINKADTLLFEKATGNLVCAFDEVGDIKGAEYERKQTATKAYNTRYGGTTLKYGLALQDRAGKKEIVPATVRNVPIFYAALTPDLIAKGYKEFNPAPDKISEFEQKLFEYLIAAISLQVKGLELEHNLDPNLKKRLNAFGKILEEYTPAKKSKVAAGGI